MRSLIAIAALVASCFAGAEPPEGVVIVCSYPQYPHIPYGYEFRDGQVIDYSIVYNEGGTEAFVAERFGRSSVLPATYVATVDSIYWGEDRRYWLNRKTLVLEVRSETGEVLLTQNCEVVASVGAMKAFLEGARQMLQKEIDDQMTGNKI